MDEIMNILISLAAAVVVDRSLNNLIN